jgi:putative ABC transport system permease protein
MNVFSQIFAITLMNLRTLPQRWTSSLVIVVGVAGVVAVLVALLSMAQGFASTLQRTGKADRVIVLRGGSNGELSSGLTINQANIVAGFPGIAQLDGQALLSPELYLIADVPKRATGSPANLTLRGVTPIGVKLRSELRISEGRMFEPGKAELIAGRGAADQFAGLDLGAEIKLRDTRMKVVGIFTADGGGHESELWMDLPVVQDLFRGPGVLSSMRVQLQSASAYPAFAAAVKDDKRLDMDATDEPTYFARQSESLSNLIQGFGYAVAVIMGIGAMFAALNTMYSAVSARTREIATLRAIGFGGAPVVASVIVESMALALLGGLFGGVFAWLMFNGATVSTLNNASFSQVAFDFAVSPELIARGIVLALLLGLMGGLLPAWRAARLPVTLALRGD